MRAGVAMTEFVHMEIMKNKKIRPTTACTLTQSRINTAQPRLHLTAFGAVCGGYLVEKMIL
jgi:hypothetical protein